jgi:hypothetical protein
MEPEFLSSGKSTFFRNMAGSARHVGTHLYSQLLRSLREDD